MLTIQIGDATTATSILRAGDERVIPGGMAWVIRNDGPTAAVALTLALFPGSGPGPSDEPTTMLSLFRPAGERTGSVAWPPGVRIQSLAEGGVSELPEGPITLAAGRLTLTPNDVIGAHDVPGVELIAVEAGVVDLSIASESFELTRANGVVEPANPGVVAASGVERQADILLVAGEAVVVRGGAIGELRDAGDAPAVVDVVVIEPAAAGAGTAMTGTPMP